MKKQLTEEERREREERRIQKVIGREVDGATALNVTLRYFMDGGRPFSGLHGGRILPFFEVLYTDSDFNKWYLTAPHEQIAGHAAEGFADSTGKVGVAVVTSGPGLTNLATPCYDAWMDSVPVVFVAGDVPRAWAGHRGFQESPYDMFRPVSKNVFYVKNAGEIPSVIAEAFRLAKSGRPGPVLVDVPTDVLLERKRFGLETDNKSTTTDATYSYSELSELYRRIGSTKLPVLCIGGGVKSAEAWNEVLEFANKSGIPVVYTLKGKGAFPDNDPRCLGPVGMHGSATANYAVEASDLLIVLGARFSDRTISNAESFAPNAYIAHFDIDPQGIGPAGRKPDLEVRGNLKASMRALNASDYVAPDLREWYAQIRDWQAKYPYTDSHEGDGIKPRSVIQTLNSLLQDKCDDVICVTDVGQHQMWAMQQYKATNPRGFLTSAGSGTMGYGLPAALGAKLGNPKKPVVVITGDASFDMLTPTLRLYKRLQPDIKVIVLDNFSEDSPFGGMVNQWLRRGTRKARAKVKGYDPNEIVSVAQGYGIPASNVKDPEKVYPSIAQAFAMKGPVVLNFKVDPYEEVFPFIPPGKSVREMEFGGRFDPFKRPY